MKVYRDYLGGDVPELEVLREGVITRIFFDFALEEKEMEGGTVEVLTCENVDVRSTDYGSSVSAIVRDKYSADAVEAILANGTDTEAHAREYEKFQEWRATAKEVATAVVLELDNA